MLNKEDSIRKEKIVSPFSELIYLDDDLTRDFIEKKKIYDK